MPRLVTGMLEIPSLAGGVEPSTYDFENAVFTNSADSTGDGAYAVQVGFAVFLPAINAFTFEVIPGVFHKYKLTAVTVNDFASISGTIAWDEPGDEQDGPAQGFGIISQPSSNRNLSLPALESVYPQLPPGISLSAVALDMVNIVDAISGGSGGDGAVTHVHTQSVASASWIINHNKNAPFTVTVFDAEGNVVIPDGIQATTSNRATLTFSEDFAGKAVFVFANA